MNAIAALRQKIPIDKGVSGCVDVAGYKNKKREGVK
jgi:hypothetical protein